MPEEKLKRVSNQPEKPWYKTLNGWKTVLECIAIPFAIAYAVVTYCQWQDLRQHFEAEQRAWLKVVHTISANTPPLVGLHVENVGKSVAKATVEVALEIVPNTGAPSLSYSTTHTAADMSILFPNDRTQDFPVVLSRNDRSFSDEEIRKFHKGDLYIAVFGRVVYTDSFGKHWTQFCRWQSYETAQGPTFSADTCVAYNKVGDGEPPR